MTSMSRVNSSAFWSNVYRELVGPLRSRDFNGTVKNFVSMPGLLWFTETDQLAVDIRIKALPSEVTKRVIYVV